MAVADRAQTFEISWRIDDEPARSGHRLQHDRGDIGGALMQENAFDMIERARSLLRRGLGVER